MPGRDLISFSLEEENGWTNEASKPEALAFVNSAGLFNSIFITPPSTPKCWAACLQWRQNDTHSCDLLPFLKGRCWPHILVGSYLDLSLLSSSVCSENKATNFPRPSESWKRQNTMLQGCSPKRCMTSPLLYIPFPRTLPATENLEKLSL